MENTTTDFATMMGDTGVFDPINMRELLHSDEGMARAFDQYVATMRDARAVTQLTEDSTVRQVSVHDYLVRRQEPEGIHIVLTESGEFTCSPETADKLKAQIVNDLCQDALDIAQAHGFNDNEIDRELLLVISEITEAQEELRNGKAVDEKYYREDGKPEGFLVELADAVIRIMHMCGKYKLPLGAAIIEKMMFNNTRPFKHGKEF